MGGCVCVCLGDMGGNAAIHVDMGPVHPDRFRAINGLIIPGGSVTLEPGHDFFDVATAGVEYAMSAFDQGIYWPVTP